MHSVGIADSWRRAFGDVAPLGHLCRIACRERWLRIHSLPLSKRYPESLADYAELLSRQNTAATTILGIDAECLFFFSEFPDQSASMLLDLLPRPRPKPTWLPELARLANEYDDLRIGALPVTWTPGLFDELLRARADDDVAPILFANLDRASAFAPYDGGADLFLASPIDVPVLRQRWSSWLSQSVDQL